MVLEEEKEINIEHLLYAMFKYTKHLPCIHYDLSFTIILQGRFHYYLRFTVKFRKAK